MGFNEKIFNFLITIANVYKSEENRDVIQRMDLNDENITEDLTALLYAFNVFFQQITGQTMDIIDFTHLLNKLAFQNLMESAHPTEKGGVQG